MTTAARRAAVTGTCLLALGGLVLLSLGVGSGHVPVSRTLAVLSGSLVSGPEATIVLNHRLPRAVVALLAGAALGAAGALTQSITRNPLAEPGTLGVSAGASLAVALGIVAWPSLGVPAQLFFAMLGAAASGFVVLAAGGVFAGRAATARLVLVGAAWSAITSAATKYLMVGSPRAFESFRHWHAGAVAPRPWGLVLVCGLMAVAALLVLIPVARAVDALGLGDDMGRALGAHPRRTWIITGVATVMLASAATAVVGPISFLGLAAPLVVRWVTGPTTLPLVLGSAVAGSLILLLADVIGRVAIPPQEVTAGVMCGLIGAPVFVAVARTVKVVRL